ncbi:MAG: hypothetical protein OXH11_21930, partial [Candidatus Aminicenantes bacterium]|nr:hypothetical protein [Candidatus Aminicenantes bacterium]
MMRFRHFFLHLFFFAFLTAQGTAAGTPVLLNRPVLVEMGDRLELFVDHHLIDRLEGARLKLHHPRPAETVIR